MTLSKSLPPGLSVPRLSVRSLISEVSRDHVWSRPRLGKAHVCYRHVQLLEKLKCREKLPRPRDTSQDKERHSPEL